MTSPAGVSATITAEHSVTLTLCLSGSRASVLADLDAILGVTEAMLSGVRLDLATERAATEQVAAPAIEPESWPQFSNRVVSFRGKEAVLRGKVYATFFQSVWEARGQIVPQEELEAQFAELAKPSNGVHTTVYRVRAILAEHIPEIELEFVGDGYRLVIKD